MLTGVCLTSAVSVTVACFTSGRFLERRFAGRCQDPLLRWLGGLGSEAGFPVPSRRTIGSDQDASPNGLPRCTRRRKTPSSASVCGPLTCSPQPGQRGNGQAANTDFSFAVPCFQRFHRRMS